MRTIGTLICALLLIGGTHLAMDRAPEAVITIEAWSPQEIHDMGWTTHPSTGLDVVGVGELVYLFGEEASGEDVFSYTWSFLEKPAGSNPTPPSLFEQRFTFRPDMVGSYKVQLNISTGSGVAVASVGITAAEYVGVGNLDGATPSFATGQCAACHADQAADWFETGHATMFSLAIDGLKSSHYNSGCIECHTVGFNEDAQAINGGFDDVADDLGWTFPAHPAAGEWQNIVDNFPELAQLANIQCENCHGPGSLHKGNAETIALSLDEGYCGRCHEEEPYHTFPTQWKNSKHANGTVFARGTSGSCAPCHSGHGAIAAFDPLSDLSITRSTQNISCAVCHDPHSADNEHQLRSTAPVVLNNGETVSFGGKGLFCMNCHKSRRDAADYVEGNVSSHYGPHHNNQADMFAGTNAIHFGYVLPSSLHRDALEDTCVSCHMAAGPATGEPGFEQLGGHSWNISVQPGASHLADMGAGIPAGGLYNTAVCADCHGEFDSFDEFPARKDHDGDGDVETAREELHGLEHDLGMFLPPVGEPEADISDSANRAWYADKPWAKKVLYNLSVVHEDGSGGMHNYAYSVALLQLSIDVAKFGVLTEGMISGVADVPNDQGRQVMVEWTRFGGDGPSDAPVEVYYVWREGDSAAGKASYRSIGDVPFASDGSLAGTIANFAGNTWTMVGSQPAATMDNYSAVVPTLFDGQDTMFMVTGHTSISTIFAATAPETGQSEDNLVPQAPSGVVAIGSDTAIMLKWATLDPDINYYEVYRSNVANFDASVMDPIAQLVETEYVDQDVVTGGTYFYQVTAYDFSGNQGEFAPEVQGIATAVELLGDVPAQFELSQNYPNPFNPTTNIEFSIPEAGKVMISIFDVSGKQVGTLVNEFMQPGKYTMPWNAQDLASGVYIYKMESGSFVQTNTMLLIK